MTSDVLTALDNLPAENRPQCIYDLCLQLKAFKNQSNVALSKLFSEIEENNYYELWTYNDDGTEKKYESFNHFCLVNYEYSRTASQSFVRIYRKFCKELKVKESDLAAIPWGNLKIVLPHVNEENVSQVLDLCKGKQKDVRAWAAARSPQDDPNRGRRYTFSCDCSQSEIVDAALDAVKMSLEKLGGKVVLDSHLWEALANHYLLEEVDMNLDDYILLLERRFDVKLQIAQEEAPIPVDTPRAVNPGNPKTGELVIPSTSTDKGVPFDFEDEEYLRKKMEEAGLEYAEIPEEFPDVIA